MKLSEMLSMCAIVKRLGGIGKATLEELKKFILITGIKNIFLKTI